MGQGGKEAAEFYVVIKYRLCIKSRSTYVLSTVPGTRVLYTQCNCTVSTVVLLYTGTLYTVTVLLRTV